MPTKRFFRNNQPYSFTWFVPEEGFDISPAFETDLTTGEQTRKAATYLIDRNPIGLSKTVLYSPLRERTGLFRTFAALPPRNHASILEFANTFGPLDRGTAGQIGTAVIRRRLKRDASNPCYYAEPLVAWCDQISRMKWLVRVWDAVRNTEQTFLKRLIRWEQDRVIAQSDASMPDWPGGKAFETVAGPEMDPRMWQKLRPGDLIDPAMLYVQRSIDRQFKQFPSQMRLLWDNNRSSLFVEPTSLIAALWLQFAKAVDGDRKYRVCEQCRQWFEIGGGNKKGDDHRRIDSRFCKNACKQKAYRKGGA